MPRTWTDASLRLRVIVRGALILVAAATLSGARPHAAGAREMLSTDVFGAQRASGGLKIDPTNSHYLLFHGRPTLLITSGEHYGAVINEDINYNAYLDELQRDGLNLTRVFSGSYREHVDEFTSLNLPANTLGPLPGRYLAPWARSNTPGYADGGNKFDLNRWDPAYFARLRAFVAAAARRRIAVEYVFFCSMYSEALWGLSPLNAANNVNGVGGDLNASAVNTLDNGAVLRYQDALVRKVAAELDRFGNVYYQIDNEPYAAGADAAATDAWQSHIVATLDAAESRLPHRHLVAEESQGAPTLSGTPAGVSILDFEYAAPPTAAVENYDLDRPMADDETGFRGSADATYRTEAWDWITAGGGIFDNLDFSFTPADPLGTVRPPADACCGGSPELRDQLGFLRRFISGLPFSRMVPDEESLSSEPSTGTARVLARPGKAYVVYFDALGSQGHEDAATLAVPEGQYRLRWFDPATGQLVASEKEAARDGTVVLSTPRFTDDTVALLSSTSGDSRTPR